MSGLNYIPIFSVTQPCFCHYLANTCCHSSFSNKCEVTSHYDFSMDFFLATSKFYICSLVGHSSSSINIYISTYIHAHKHTCIHSLSVCVCVCVCVYVYMYTYITIQSNEGMLVYLVSFLTLNNKFRESNYFSICHNSINFYNDFIK